MKSYTLERRAFDRLKSDCSSETKAEYEEAVRNLVGRYNTTIHENRFIVGGAVEVFTFALLRSVGISCTLYGDESRSGDILLQHDRKISVKSSFTGINNIKLINQMGGGDRQWDTATLFVIAGVGIVFGTPNMVNDKATRPTGDGLELRKAGLQHLVNDSANVFQLDIAHKPPTETTGFSEKASTAVARQILSDLRSSNLQRAIRQSSIAF